MACGGARAEPWIFIEWLLSAWPPGGCRANKAGTGWGLLLPPPGRWRRQSRCSHALISGLPLRCPGRQAPGLLGDLEAKQTNKQSNVRWVLALPSMGPCIWPRVLTQCLVGEHRALTLAIVGPQLVWVPRPPPSPPLSPAPLHPLLGRRKAAPETPESCGLTQSFLRTKPQSCGETRPRPADAAPKKTFPSSCFPLL